MNRYGEIADELTEMIEQLDQPDLVAYAGPLKLALERAFARACEAERRMRLEEPAPRRRKVVCDVDHDGACAPERPGGAVIITLADRRRGLAV